MSNADSSLKNIDGSSVAEPMVRGITPEILTVIESAANSFLGRSVRIVSVTIAKDPAVPPSAWVAQGRDIIHGSRNQVQRGH